jgi:hypothetical protein
MAMVCGIGTWIYDTTGQPRGDIHHFIITVKTTVIPYDASLFSFERVPNNGFVGTLDKNSYES